MDDKLIDTDFGINYQAFAVLQYLKHVQIEDLATDYQRYNHSACTRLMHNCREQGIAIVLSRPADDVKRVIWWAEHRNSDGIFVDWFDTEKLSDTFNYVPTVRDMPEDGSKWDFDTGSSGRKCFGHAEIAPVCRFITDLVGDFWR